MGPVGYLHKEFHWAAQTVPAAEALRGARLEPLGITFIFGFVVRRLSDWLSHLVVVVTLVLQIGLLISGQVAGICPVYIAVALIGLSPTVSEPPGSDQPGVWPTEVASQNG